MTSTSPPLRTAVSLGGLDALEQFVGVLPKGAEHHIWAVKQGAECWRCPLLASGRGPVPPTYPPGTDAWQPVDITVVAEAPGTTEVERGQTLCLEEDTLFLTADLTWKRLADAQPGDTVVGVEETAGDATGVSGKAMRRWRVGSITGVHKRAAACLEVTTAQGRLCGTPDHVVMTRGSGYTPRWTRMDRIVSGAKYASHLYSIGAPWSAMTSFDAGWLAGFLDGEGSVQGSNSARVRRAGVVVYTQNEGVVLDNAVRVVAALGFTDKLYAKPLTSRTGKRCHRRLIKGGIVETLRFLGQVRPLRLLENFIRVLPRTSVRDLIKSRVSTIRPVGVRNVVDIQTTIGTFVANGFVVHNCGASGKAVRKALTDAGARMDRVGLTNAILCQPAGDLKSFLRTAKKQGLASPIDCCRPRLLEELNATKYAVLMGGASLSAVGLDDSVMTLRGTPLTINLPTGPLPALATPHAAFVMRDEGRVFKPIFEADFRKAVRIAYSGSTWRDPMYFVPKNATEIHNFLAVSRPRVAVDVETDGIDAWTCNLRRIGIGTDTECMIYSPLSVRGHLLLSGEEIQAQSRAIAAYFATQPRMDLHNGIAFDSVVLWRHGMPLVDDHVFDTLIGHQVGNTSELPHGLDFLGSVYTDAPFWKNNFKHSTVKDDALLDKYLSFDIAVTFLAAPFVEYNLKTGVQESVYRLDHELFKIGRSMSYLGVGVNYERRFAFAQEYQEKSDKLLAEFKEAAGRDVNPGSPPQIRTLLYKDFGLLQLDEHFTSTGEPSTDENTLLDLLSLGVDKRAEKLIHALLGFRAAEKVLSTNTGHVVNGKLEGGVPVHLDGRMRPTWRPGKRSGRWGSNDPNTQNIPKKLRAMFVPHEGNVFVAADMSAVELRMIALLAGDGPLIQAFADFDAGTGPDVHIFNACTVFKTTPDKVTEEVRTFIKRFVYALSYDAQPPKIHQTLSLLRDDNLRPLFPGITLAEVERLYAEWWKLHPAIPAWKKKLIYGWRSLGFIETQWHKRKRYFIGGERQEEMGNHPVQGSSADMQNDAIVQLASAYPFDFVNHRGLNINGHDQLVVECAISEAEEVKKLVNKVMQKKIGPMLFPAVAKAGEDWKVVS